MTNSPARIALLSSVSTAAAIFLLPAAAHAQTTTCSQTGTTITCVDGAATVLTATTSASTSTIPGPGLVTVDTTGPSTTSYIAAGPIATTAAPGISLTSTGGALSFTPTGTNSPVNISTIGGNAANGLTLNTAGQAATVTVGNISTTGTNSFGVLSTGGSDLTLKTGSITTTGATSVGLQATNQTGNISIVAGDLTTTGRGLNVRTLNAGTATVVTGNVNAGQAGILVNGGTASVTTGNVTTSTNGGTTAGGFGVAAQAFNGNATIRTGTVNTVNGFGIFANAVNATGSADVGGCPSVSTTGNNATAVIAQATGTGAVTINCGVLTATGLNSNGVFANANGGNVLVNITSATTSGDGGYGVTANTSGTGTVTTNAGVIATTGLGSTGLFGRSGTGAIDAGYGNITTSGLVNGGNSAAALDLSTAGTINLRGGGSTLRTNGAGVTAAIVNGAGVTGNLGNVTTTGVGAQGAIITSTGPVNLTAGTVATTGNALTINAGANPVTLTTGTVTATDAGATGTVINSTGAVQFTGGRQAANGANALLINGGAGAINASVAGAATTGVGNAVVINGTGPLTFANTGAITTTGATSSGITIAGVTTATVNCGNVSTTGANSPAFVLAANGATNVNCGTVTTTGAASDAIVVSNTAGITTVTGTATSATGAGSRGIVVSSTAPAGGLVTVTTGTVAASGNAVEARSAGTSGVTVNANANVVSTAGAGVTLTTAGGSAIVNQVAASTITAATDAIKVNNTVGGAITVNALGTLVANNGSGVFVNTSAASADPINVTTNIVRSTGGAGTWGSQVRASAGTGDITINSNGVMSSAGAPGTMFGGILALTNGTANRNVTVNVNANIGSPTDRSSAAQVLISGTSSTAKTLAVNVANASIFGGPAAIQVTQNATSLGDIRIIGTGTGTLDANGPAGIGVNARILNAANPGNILVDLTQSVFGTVQGINAVTLGRGNVTVAARGGVTSTTGTAITAGSAGTTLVTIGAGTTVTGLQGVSLQGGAGNTLVVNGTLRNTAGTAPYTLGASPFTLTLGSTGTITGPLVFTGFDDTFNNQGTYVLPLLLDFGAGVDVLNNTGTLSAALTGPAVITGLETFNNAGGLIDLRDGVANDVLTLSGTNYVASGNARLGIDVVGTGGVNTADRLVIGGTTTGTTTVLANFVNPVIDTTGALIVDSALNNLTAGQFVFAGNTSQGLINYAIQLRGGDAFLVSTPDARIFDTVLMGRQLRDLWYSSADAYNAYAAARRVDFGSERTNPVGIWAQLYGERQTSRDRTRNITAFGTPLTVSDGIRTNFRGAQGGVDFGASNFVIGLTGGYGRAEGTTAGLTDLTTEAYNYGAYAQFGMTNGLYAGVLVKRDDYRNRINNGNFQNGFASPRSHSTGVEGEIGLRTGGVSTINFDFGVGAAYVRTDTDTFNFGNIAFDANEATSVRGNAHIRATFAGKIAPFIEARGFHEFRDDNGYTLNSGLGSATIDGEDKGTWVRLEAGLGGGVGGGPLISAWVNVGDTRGYGLRAGFRF